LTSAAQEEGVILDHKTLYVGPEIGGAHRFEIAGAIKEGAGDGTLVIDKNKCELDPFGNRTTCTQASFPPLKVRFARLRLPDPAMQGREVYSISGPDLPKNLTFTLAIGRKETPNVFRLVVEEDGKKRSAFPSVPKKEFDK
jgi:hypothetical protein